MSDLLTYQVRIPASPAAVYAGLTDATSLCGWLADGAEVSLPDGRFEFWGPHVPAGVRGRQRLLAAERDRSLRFAWTLDGEETTVEIGLEPDGADATVVTLSQTGFPPIEDVMAGRCETIRGALHTFWALAFVNLADHLAGRPITPRADYANSTGDTVRAEVTIDDSPAEVFASLVDPDRFRRWFGAEIEVTAAAVGGTFLFNGEPFEILAFEPDGKLSFSWENIRPGGALTWELADSGGKTRLTIVQSGFSADQVLDFGGWAGWLSGVGELRRMHELGSAWRPIHLID